MLESTSRAGGGDCVSRRTISEISSNVAVSGGVLLLFLGEEGDGFRNNGGCGSNLKDTLSAWRWCSVLYVSAINWP